MLIFSWLSKLWHEEITFLGTSSGRQPKGDYGRGGSDCLPPYYFGEDRLHLACLYSTGINYSCVALGLQIEGCRPSSNSVHSITYAMLV